GTARTWRGFARTRVRATTPIGRLVTIRPLPIRTVVNRNRVHERTSQAARCPGPPAADSRHQQRLQAHFPCTRLTEHALASGVRARRSDPFMPPFLKEKIAR